MEKFASGKTTDFLRDVVGPALFSTDYEGDDLHCLSRVLEEDKVSVELLRAIARLALDFDPLLDFPHRLKANEDSILTIDRRIVASMLARAFCGYPLTTRSLSYPELCMLPLFSCTSRSKAACEKLRCLIAYFRYVTSESALLGGHVSFHRKSMGPEVMPEWRSLNDRPLLLPGSHVSVVESGRIEDADSAYERVDFANRFVGGGVLQSGCVQEEILFVTHPELLISMLFVECLGDREALVVTGVYRFSRYSGYSSSFRFDGAVDSLGDPLSFICIDATHFGNGGDRMLKQLGYASIKRELDKLLVGFSGNHNQPLDNRKIATGNWGCGAFGGDVQLKFLLQLLVFGHVSTGASGSLLYYTFGDSRLDDAHLLIDLLRSITSAQLLHRISEYRQTMGGTLDLFQHLLTRSQPIN
eukprot:Partr_v1_DN28712_c3_g1_i4_m62941 putative Poly (ADP-ribose) glycohydrolase